MSRPFSILALLLALLVGCGAQPARPAQPTTPTTTTAPTSVFAASSAELRQQIEAALTRSAAAYNAGDYDAFVSIYSEEPEASMIVDAPALEKTENGSVHIVEGGQAIRELYRAAPMFKEGFVRPALSYADVRVHQLAADLAWVAAICVMNGGDERVPRRAITTLIMRRVEGSWRVVHDHTR